MSRRATIRWRGPDAVKRLRKGARRGLGMAADHVLGEAVDITPIEEAVLIGSGTASTHPSKLRAAVSFDTPYAVRQHEDLTLRHDPGRRAKYLEEPLQRERAVVAAIVARETRRELHR